MKIVYLLTFAFVLNACQKVDNSKEIDDNKTINKITELPQKSIYFVDNDYRDSLMYSFYWSPSFDNAYIISFFPQSRELLFHIPQKLSFQDSLSEGFSQEMLHENFVAS